MFASLRVPALVLMILAAVPAAAQDPAAAPPQVAAADLQDGPEGLRYADLERGDGDPLQAGTRVPIAVRLWNTPDDPPVEIGSATSPLQVVVGGGTLIRGLDVGLVGMRRGGVRYLDIPAELTSGAGIPMQAVITVLDPDAPTSEPARASSSSPNRGTTGPSAPGTREPPDDPPDVPDDAFEQRKNGLRIADLVEGTGEPLDKGQTVVVEYTGWVADTGERFDSSLARAEPFSFTVGAGQVILGWDKGLRGMKVGGTRVLQIPAYLAYGASGAGSIPPHADLLFQVQLLDIR